MNKTTEEVTFFSDAEDLERLTRLTYNELWEHGFDLDDMDFGIQTDTEWSEDWDYQNEPYYRCLLLQWMDNHCVGYRHTEYKGKHYYTVHHA